MASGGLGGEPRELRPPADASRDRCIHRDELGRAGQQRLPAQRAALALIGKQTKSVVAKYGF